MNSFKLNQRWEFSGPSTWAELTPRQAVVLMRFRGRVNQENEIIFPVLELLYGITMSQQRWLFDDGFLKRKGISAEGRVKSLANGQALVDTLRWIGETEPEATFLVPSFRLYDFQFGSAGVLRQRAWHLTQYFGPGEGLANCSFGELIYADEAYKKSNWPQLAAVLYRPTGKKSPADDSREPFDATELADRTALFSQLDPALLSLITAHFEACMRELQRYFPLIFSKPSPDEPATKTNTSAGWFKVAIGMAKLDATKVPQIEHLNLYLILSVLSEQIQQADELEEQLEKMRNKK